MDISYYFSMPGRKEKELFYYEIPTEDLVNGIRRYFAEKFMVNLDGKDSDILYMIDSVGHHYGNEEQYNALLDEIVESQEKYFQDLLHDDAYEKFQDDYADYYDEGLEESMIDPEYKKAIERSVAILKEKNPECVIYGTDQSGKKMYFSMPFASTKDNLKRFNSEESRKTTNRKVYQAFYPDQIDELEKILKESSVKVSKKAKIDESFAPGTKVKISMSEEKPGSKIWNGKTGIIAEDSGDESNLGRVLVTIQDFPAADGLKTVSQDFDREDIQIISDRADNAANATPEQNPALIPAPQPTEFKAPEENNVYKQTESVHNKINEDLGDSKMTRKEALFNYLKENEGLESVDEVEETSFDENYFDTPFGEYMVLTEEEADNSTREYIKQTFDELGLDAFTESFQDWIKNNAMDQDFFEDAVREDFEYYVNDIENEESSGSFGNRLIEELFEHDLLTDDDFEEDENGFTDYSMLKESVDIEKLKLDLIDSLMADIDDYIGYIADNMGKETVVGIIEEHPEVFNIDMIVDECISEDGRGHFLASYDGAELELDGDYYAYRVN